MQQGKNISPTAWLFLKYTHRLQIMKLCKMISWPQHKHDMT